MSSLYRLLKQELQFWNGPYVESTTFTLHKWMIDDLGVLSPFLAPKRGIDMGAESKLVVSYRVNAILKAFVSEKMHTALFLV
jgi:hypothetical protein